MSDGDGNSDLSWCDFALQSNNHSYNVQQVRWIENADSATHACIHRLFEYNVSHLVFLAQRTCVYTHTHLQCTV